MGHLGNTTYIEKCATVEGVAVAKNSASSIKIGDTYYAESGLTGKSYSAASWTDYKNTYTFYLDNGNNIVKAVAQTAEVVSNYGCGPSRLPGSAAAAPLARALCPGSAAQG